MSEKVVYTLEDGLAVIRMDDGKANALSPDLLDELASAFDHARADQAGALVLLGRPGRFSAGFDLSIMGSAAPQEQMALLAKGANLALRIFESPVPVVLGVTGHAIAMGAVLCLAADVRIGMPGNYKIGLNEVAIGMTLPDFVVVLAEDRISRPHLIRATASAEIFSPEAAVSAGFLDRLADDGEVEQAALSQASAMASSLDANAHHRTKSVIRRSATDQFRAAVAALSPP